jgi:hypothetical protein
LAAATVAIAGDISRRLTPFAVALASGYFSRTRYRDTGNVKMFFAISTPSVFDVTA